MKGVVYHNDDNGDNRVLDVAVGGGAWKKLGFINQSRHTRVWGERKLVT